MKSEKEYRDYIYEKASKVTKKSQLDALLDEVINGKEELGYGTIVYAISACMNATMRYIDNSKVGGITGFQASFIGWEMVKEYFSVSRDTIGLKLVDYDNMLYPQYSKRFDKVITKSMWEKMQNKARSLLEQSPNAHPDVLKHWKKIASGKVPFGYKVVED